MTHLRILPVSIFALILIGAGCSEKTDTNPIPEVKGDSVTEQNEENNENNTELTLTGSITGTNSVKLAWSPSETLAETAEQWMIVEGTETNPTYPEKYRYYYLTDASYRERNWKNLPTGTSYFRICAWVDNACTVYSDTLSLEIPGRMQNGK